MEAKVYSFEGKEVRTVSLADTMFKVAWNANLMHDVVTALRANARAGTAEVKDRGEVSGGGRKPWKQKGTGRARHGSRRSPIWVHGGVAHGPTSEKDYVKKINRNVRAKALATALSKKYEDGEVLFVESFAFSEPKTARAKQAVIDLSSISGMESLKTKRKNAATVILPARDTAFEKSFANFGNIEVIQAKDVSVVDILTNKYVVIVSPDASLEVLGKRVSTKQTRKVAA